MLPFWATIKVVIENSFQFVLIEWVPIVSSLESIDLWPTLGKLSGKAKSRKAAVAYVTSEEHIRFTDGDALVVDASDDAIAEGKTSASVLEAAFARGAKIYSLANLHAKIFVFDGVASVGSANISKYSANVLVEANWVSDMDEFHTSAIEFIDQQIEVATQVDQDFIDRILQIEVRNTGRNRYRRQRSHPILLYFQEVLPGDIKKYQAMSASSGTGGGARDLRISPINVYEQTLRRMFPNPSDGHATTGTIVWESGGAVRQSEVTLQSPTNARRTELRIGRFYDIGGWEIDPAQYDLERSQGLIWFYILEMGLDGIVYARLLQLQHLGLEDPLVVEHLTRQRERTGEGHATRGAVDLQNRICIPAD